MAAILPEDAGIIRCICGFKHDDNFTIQCERCNAWQHARCLGIKDEPSIPEHYLCPDCGGKPDGDPKRARALQQHFLASSRFPKPDAEEERPRRGRKRSVNISGLAADSVAVYAKYYNVESAKNRWTPAAMQAWHDGWYDDLKTVTNRELKQEASVSVVRLRDAKKFRLGLNDTTLIAETTLQPRKIALEVVGQVLTRKEYAADAHNQFAKLGCPKRGVVFVPGLPFAVDSRRTGSLAVFVRRSSEPTCRLVARRDTKGELRVLLVAQQTIKPGDELTLGWHWPESHPVALNRGDSIANTIYWLLDVSPKDCRPVKNESGDEDWEVCSVVIRPPPPRKRRGELVQPQVDAEDTQTGSASLVWEPATENIPLPPKKRFTLQDYLKNKPAERNTNGQPK